MPNSREAPGTTVAPPYAERWNRASARASAEGFDGLYLTTGATFTWLSGYAPYPGGWPDFLSCLLVPLDRDPVMLISAMHAEILDRSACAIDQVFTYTDGEDPRPVLRAAFAAAGLDRARLAVEDQIWLSDVELAASAAPATRFTRSDLFEGLRAVKDPGELALLRQSATCQDAAYAAARDVMRAGGDLGEAEVAVRSAMLAGGCETIKLLGIFRARRPRTFVAGELIDIDFGTAFCGGYTIDSSRNVFFGDPGAELLALWQVVEDAYQAAIAAVRPGVTAEAVHRAGAEPIEAAGHRQTWKMGHGVGLSDGHEAPWLQQGSQTILEPGMTFTIDPGFFLGRDLPLHIEDTVVVTERGCESLNEFPRSIIAV
jgi:Xaa-Pro aminopeptidase